MILLSRFLAQTGLSSHIESFESLFLESVVHVPEHLKFESSNSSSEADAESHARYRTVAFELCVLIFSIARVLGGRAYAATRDVLTPLP